ncbi:MAG: hypothetical protein ABEJ35_04685 [Halobacteriaceae archaeon]
MVEDHVESGRRIAELLASEVDGRSDGGLAALAVTNADTDVTPSADGAKAYDITAAGTRIATVYVHPDRARVDVVRGQSAARAEVEGRPIRARSVGGARGRLLMFVADGVAVKRLVPVLTAAARATEGDEPGIESGG